MMVLFLTVLIQFLQYVGLQEEAIEIPCDSKRGFQSFVIFRFRPTKGLSESGG